jgi:RimJ/RimL family protein N-acetyltransferase
MLETERLRIRPFLPADADAIYALVYADLDVKQHWSGYKGTLEEFKERFRTDKLYTASERDHFHYYALVRKADDVLLGLMGFQNHANGDTAWLRMPDGSCNVGHIPDVLDVELTYALGKDYWGQGYAMEAGSALIPYGFAHLNIDRIINAISPTNLRSRNLMLRLGFVFLDNGNPDDAIGLLENPALT